MLDMQTRWRRIRKQFLSGVVRFIPKQEAFELFDILEKYELGLIAALQMSANGSEPDMKAVHRICADALKD